MNAATLHQSLFGTPWRSCLLTLTSGEVLRLDHPDWVLMPPGRSWLMVVLPEDRFRIIAPDHVVSAEVETLAPPLPSASS